MRSLRDNPALWHVLEERARALAAVDTQIEEGLGEEILVFRLGDGRYCLPAQHVREVYPLVSYTPLPSTPAFVIGLVNVRGRLLTALDLRPLIEIDAAPPHPDSMLLIIAANGTEVGLLADSVLEVRRASLDITPTLSAASGRAVAWVRGVDQELNLLLDPVLLLADQRLVVNHEQK